MASYDMLPKLLDHRFGIACFALFLVFLALSKVGGKNKTITLWIFLGLSVISLIGGLLIEWQQPRLPEAKQPTAGNGNVQITQNNGPVTTGHISTNVENSTLQQKSNGLGNIHIQGNKENVKTGNIKTEVTTNTK